MKKMVAHLLALGLCLILICFILMPGDTLAGEAAGHPAVKQVDVAWIDLEDQGRSTIVKVELTSAPDALEDSIASLELRDADGNSYPFGAEEFHSTDDGDFYLKWLPFWLPGDTAVLMVRDVEGIEHEFPADQPPAASTPQERAMAGDWSGTTGQPGGYVNFTVSGTNVVNFQIRMYVCGTGCTWVLSTVFTIPVSGDSFSYNSFNLDITGTFTSETTATGTWDYHDIVFGGYGDGTWQADISADDPPEIESIDYQDCLSELCTTPISVSATDPEGGALTYEWVELNGPGGLLNSNSGANVIFDPPDTGPHACPYQVRVTATSGVSGLSSSETIDVHVRTSGDVTGDGVVNLSDLNEIRDNFMQHGDPGWIDADINCDAWVNLSDLNLIRDNFMSLDGCACPP